AAHALPSCYKSQRIGTLSEITAFSFYATKTLTTGEGGMITTNNDSYAERMQMMRLHGISRDAWNRHGAGQSWRYEVQEAGYKYNLTDLQSAIGIVQLAKCDEMNSRRQLIAKRYNDAFARLGVLEIPKVLSDRQSSWHLYVLRLLLDQLQISRDRFIEELDRHGVSASVHFIPLHLQPYYQRRFGYEPGDYPVAEREYSCCLSLPIYPAMTDEEIDYVIHTVIDIAQHWAR
ncbi:MAG TPA: DegT/DnrJ/EryC1/StrS family aminotransferase, partial [Terriglobales bacterium]|nr:DegT/DnrJ/EryC1/StrS family aminotransferase [Terriglobales bacterium]